MIQTYDLSDAERSPRPASPQQQARLIVYQPSLGHIFSLDSRRLSLPSLTREVTPPTRGDIASLMSETYHFSLPVDRYRELERTISVLGEPLTYYLAALGAHEEMPGGASIPLTSIRHKLYAAAPEDFHCLQKHLFLPTNLC